MSDTRLALSPLMKTLPLALMVASLGLGSIQASGLESLDDGEMADVNGAGIAFLPEQVLMALQTPGTGFPGSTTADITNRANDTGYIRYIPVGPLSDASLTTTNNPLCWATLCTVGKADLFLYGLALSRSDGNSNTRMNADATATNRYIQSWGTATNPWLIKVQSQANVPNFDTGTGTGTVSYLALETPFYNTTLPADRASGLDAYNLKLGLWADIFNRRWDAVENLTATGTQFDVGGAGRQNRLRLQAIWDGFSLNGSNIKMFQTLGGATDTGGMSTFYNNTLGLAALIRLNSGDTSSLRATFSGTPNTRTVSAWTVTWDGNSYGTAANYTNTSGTSGGAPSPACTASNATHNAAGTSCTTRFQTRTTTDSGSTTNWTAPSSTRVLRISTREASGTAVDLTTPAINGGSAPTFAAEEGMYLYSPNINLPLGSLAQPVIAGVAADGRNLVLELSRIPNKASAYEAIYTDYDNTQANIPDATVRNCNVHRCGAALTGPLAGYQASSATHGSISIGSTVYDSATNSLRAYSGVEAVGVSFAPLQTATFTTTIAAGTYREVQRGTRTATSGSWNVWSNWADLAVGQSANYNLAANGTTTFTAQAVPAVSMVPTNNLGSVAIDGLLIQHLKFTTTGL